MRTALARDRWVLHVCAALTVAPLALSRHLPFCDLPEHVAVMATLRHWWSPGWRAQELFTAEGWWRTPYWLYHVAGALLAVPLGGAERANLFLLVAVGLGFPYALRSLLAALRLDTRLAVFGCLLFFNRALAEGLLNFVASIPLALYALATFARHVRKPSPHTALGLAALALALLYLHLSSFLVFAAGAAALAVILRPLRRASLVVRGAWVLPASLALLFLALGSSLTHPRATEGAHAGVVHFLRTGDLVRQLPAWMHDFWTSPVDEIVAGIAWVALGTLIIRRAKVPRRTLFAALALLVVALGAYFALPTQVGFAFLLDLRMAPFVGLFATLLAAPRRGALAEGALRVIAVASVISSIHACWQMRAYEKSEGAPLDDVLANMPRGKKLLQLTFAPGSAYTRITPFIHAGAYYRIRYGGVASFSFSELPYWPVRYRPEAAPPKKQIVFWEWAPCAYRNTVDGPYYDYILARGMRDPIAPGTPGPRWKLVGGSAPWRLYQREDTAWNVGTDGVGPCPGGQIE